MALLTQAFFKNKTKITCNHVLQVVYGLYYNSWISANKFITINVPEIILTTNAAKLP